MLLRFFKMLPHLSSPVQFVIKLQIFIHFTVQVSKLFRAGHVFGFRSLFICPLAFCGHSTCHRWLRLETSFVRVVLGPGGSLSERRPTNSPKPRKQKNRTKNLFPTARQAGKVGKLTKGQVHKHRRDHDEAVRWKGRIVADYIYPSICTYSRLPEEISGWQSKLNSTRAQNQNKQQWSNGIELQNPETRNQTPETQTQIQIQIF